MDVTVRDLTVSVAKQDKKEDSSKVLLKDVCFHAAPSELVALMGPSGAGKTTLLNQLVGQGTKGLKTSGNIRFGENHEVTGCESTVANRGSTGPSQDVNGVRSQVGYVTQDDIMYESLTPRENLNFAACFLQAGSTAAERASSVDMVLEKLHLQSCADTVVGTPGLVKGISGGERKRTNVAMSLLGLPALMLLDEPTSGLDAKMAYELMADLSAVAEQGCTIIATIHQPSEACFQHFTKVLLLSAGRVAYFGPVKGLADRLTTLGFQMPERVPLPEVLLDILEVSAEDKAEEHTARLQALFDASEPMPLTEEQVMARVSSGGAGLNSMAVNAPADPVDDEAAADDNAAKPDRLVQRLGFCGQIVVLTRRNVLSLRRNKVLTVVRIMQTIMSTILISWIFVQLPGDLTGVRSRLFGTFMLGIAQMLFAMIGVVNTFPAERAIFLRESQDRWYHPVSYYLSTVVIDSIMQCCFPIFVLIGYFLIGLNSSVERVLVFYVTLCVLSNAGSATGFIVSASVSNVAAGLSIAPGLMMPNLLLAGVFLPVNALPQPFRVLSYLSIARYALQALIFNEFTCEVDTACGPAQRMLNGEACANSPCNFCCSATDVLTTGGVCPVVTCDDALMFLKMELDEAWPTGDTTGEAVLHNLLALLVVTILFRMLGLVALLIAYRRAVK